MKHLLYSVCFVGVFLGVFFGHTATLDGSDRTVSDPVVPMVESIAQQASIKTLIIGTESEEATDPATTPDTTIPEDTLSKPDQEAAESAPQVDPVSDEQLDAGYLDGWFSDSAIVGDSIVGGLTLYVNDERYKNHTCLGDVKLVYASALTLKKAYECEQKKRTPELKLRSKYMTISEVVTTLGVKRLFIMLGASDLRWFSPQEYIAAYDGLIQIVLQDHPDLEIYVHSIVPMVKEYAKQVNLTAEQNIEINNMLREYCKEKGYGFIELSDHIRDDEGFLPRELSAGDYRFHLNSAGKKIWVRCLREYAREEYYQGKWSLGGN
jgi:hypothetical protein